MSTILAVDIGYSSLKISYGPRGASPDQISTLILPSIAAPSARVAKTIGAHNNQSDDIKIWYDGTEYSACIRPEYTRSVRAVHEDYPLEDTYQVLYRAALLLTGEKEIECVVTGLPVSQAQDQTRVSRLRALMMGQIEVAKGYTVTVKDVNVIPQPVGAYMEMIKEWEGPKTLLHGNIVVIDPGYFSVDWLSIKHNRVQWDASGTNLAAMSQILTEAAGILATRNGGWVDPESLESALRDGKDHIVAMGQPMQIEPVLNEAGKYHAREAVRALRTALRQERAEPGIVILAGGGANTYKKYVADAFPGWTIWTGKKPAVSNVRGFWFLQDARR